MKYLYFLQLVPKTYTPISLQDHQLEALLYVDDVDLAVRNSEEESEEEIHTRAQQMIDTWQYMLKVISRDLKLQTCY